MISETVGNYNNVGLHSALSLLHPIDYHCMDPAALLSGSVRKLRAATELRTQETMTP
ncbi:MAG: hypothetical protein JSV19_01620 [Phycisphaerales bacterium]|nr:MAG: hypothetical protein JSV19_01620 [Phycisphaerales bacterium]